MEFKRNNSYMCKAFNSLKWNWEMATTQHSFNSIVKHRELKDHFVAWFEQYKLINLRREKLLKILNEKHYYDNLEAFGIWKKDTFFRTMVNLIDEFVVVPQEENLLQDTFYAWRRASEFERYRENYEVLADANSNYLTMKHIFSQWKGIVQPNMKKYLTLKTGLRKITTVMLTQPFYHLLAISEKEKIKEKQAYFFNKEKQYQMVFICFKEWRETIKELKADKMKIKHISHYFNAKFERSQPVYSEIESEDAREMLKTGELLPTFKLPVKIIIQTGLIKSFQAYTETTPRVLMQKYMNAMKYNLKQQRVRREQLEYSSKYYAQKLKGKYLELLVEAYNAQIDLQQNQVKADQHYYARMLERTFYYFCEGIRVSKKEAICDSMYQAKLKQKSLIGFKMNIEINQKKDKLNALMVKFVKDRSHYLLNHTYFAWKSHFELERYYSMAIQEFKDYRSSRLLKT